jgi:hypothetical protein
MDPLLQSGGDVIDGGLSPKWVERRNLEDDICWTTANEVEGVCDGCPDVQVVDGFSCLEAAQDSRRVDTFGVDGETVRTCGNARQLKLKRVFGSDTATLGSQEP